MPQPKKERTTEDGKAAFLAALELTANVSESAKAAKVNRKTVYVWRDADAEFAAEWEKALPLGTDSLEDEAIRRATVGTLKPIFQRGEHVGDVREYSDTLLIFMLKARRPEKYRENSRVELAGDPDRPLNTGVLVCLPAKEPVKAIEAPAESPAE